MDFYQRAPVELVYWNAQNIRNLDRKLAATQKLLEVANKRIAALEKLPHSIEG